MLTYCYESLDPPILLHAPIKPPASFGQPSFVQDCDPLAGSLWCLRVPVPRQVLPRGNRGQPLPLSPLVLAHTAAPNTFDIRCQNQGCANFNNVSSAVPS